MEPPPVRAADEATLATTEALHAAAAALEGAAFDYRDLSEARELIFGAAAAAAPDQEDDDLEVRPVVLFPSLFFSHVARFSS
jgi:hypothetical protein